MFKELLPEEWVVREYTPDYGIDLEVELFEKMKDGYYRTKGEHVMFQIKGVSRAKQKKIKAFNMFNVEKKYEEDKSQYLEIDVIQFNIDVDLLSTVERMGSAIPVLLAVVDIENQKAYYVCLNDYIEKILYPTRVDFHKQKTITINIPVTNCLNDEKGKRRVEWYGKRAKLYEFFNKVHYQRSELDYTSEEYYEQQTLHFLNRLKLLDVWSAVNYFPWLYDVKINIDSYLNDGTTPMMKEMHKNMIEDDDYDETEEWTSPLSGKEIPLSDCMRYMSLQSMWSQMNNLANIFEEDAKEFFLPTFFYYSTYAKAQGL